MTGGKRSSVAGRRHLVLQLRQGWTYDSRSRRFVKNGQDAFRPGDDLPKYTRIQFQVPAMARKSSVVLK